jgi:Kef-type K+ transport system membrane component KefB
MHQSADLPITLITLGAILIVGVATDEIGRRTTLPRVTLLLVFGCIIGPSVLDLLPKFGEQWFSSVSVFALIMVGFLLGGKLTLGTLRLYGQTVVWLSTMVVIGTAAIVFGGLIALGISIPVALLLAGISTATAPAATADVVHEARARGPFARILLGIVSLDDAWGLILFSLLMAITQSLIGRATDETVIWTIVREIGGAIAIGGAIGIPMAYLTGRIKKGEPTQAEALGLVFLCGGLAMWLEVSYLLAAMTMGMTVTNLARHHKRPFHEIERIEWPFLILFFVLAGGSLQLDSLGRIGLLGTGYILLRVAGKILGAWIGAVVSGSGPFYRKWMGTALLPQAGVAVGMALVAVQKFPEMKDVILPVVIGSTVLFELIGPILTRMALIRAQRIEAIENR